MKTCLVTGGAGFLGSHLCAFLLEKGYYVISVDNLLTGNNQNIVHLQNNKHFHFLQHDICNPLSLHEDIHYVLHFASPASPFDYQKKPIETLNVGAFGTKQALELAWKKNAVFLLASTSEVYGDPIVSPQSETYFGNVNSVGPRSCYDESKRFAEALVMAYHRVHGINTKIVRIFNTYGPKMRIHDGRVIPAFISAALQNKPLTVFGDGTQTRSFCYVDDLIEGIYALLLFDIHDPVNIGNPNEFTMLELAQKILVLTESKSTLAFYPLPADDPKQRKPDITKARALLHWKPEIMLDDGLLKTIHWFREQLGC